MTTKVEHSEKNIEKLAQAVTDSGELYDYYKNNKEAFLTDWEDMEMEDENP